MAKIGIPRGRIRLSPVDVMDDAEDEEHEANIRLLVEAMRGEKRGNKLVRLALAYGRALSVQARHLFWLH